MDNIQNAESYLWRALACACSTECDNKGAFRFAQKAADAVSDTKLAPLFRRFAHYLNAKAIVLASGVHTPENIEKLNSNFYLALATVTSAYTKWLKNLDFDEKAEDDYLTDLIVEVKKCYIV